MLLSIENISSRHEETWKGLKHVLLKKKKKILRGDKLSDSNYMTFWKRQNYGDSKSSVVAKGWGEGRMNRAEHRGF